MVAWSANTGTASPDSFAGRPDSSGYSPSSRSVSTSSPLPDDASPEFLQAVALRACQIATARALCDLAQVKSHEGRDWEADQHAFRALAIYEEHVGSEHDGTLRALAALMAAYNQQGKLADAERALPRAEELYTASANRKACAGRGMLACEIALAYAARGSVTEGVQMAAESVKQCREVFGARSLDTSHALHTLATLHLHQGRHMDAERLAAEALSTVEGVMGMHHVNTVPPRTTLVEVLKRSGRFHEADRLVEVSLAIVDNLKFDNPDKAEPKRHPAAVHLLVEHCNIREAMGDLSRAQDTLKRAVELMEANLDIFPEAHTELHRNRLMSMLLGNTKQVAKSP